MFFNLTKIYACYNIGTNEQIEEYNKNIDKEPTKEIDDEFDNICNANEIEDSNKNSESDTKNNTPDDPNSGPTEDSNSGSLLNIKLPSFMFYLTIFSIIYTFLI